MHHMGAIVGKSTPHMSCFAAAEIDYISAAPRGGCPILKGHALFL